MFDELKKLFIQEVKELLEKTEKNLLSLETNNTDTEAMDEVFRSMHTIKGSAGVYGLNKTVNLAHDFENVFSKIKENKLSISKKIISLALKAKDIILRLVEANSEEDVQEKELVEITDEIKRILESVKLDNTIISTKKQSDTKDYNSYYILFEPNDNFFDRNLKIDDILSDFNSFQYKIVTKIEDKNRKGKLNELYEIIVATDYKVDDLEAIFLFVSEEVIFNEIIKSNIFIDNDFTHFYENAIKILPFSEQRFELIQKYGKSISHSSQKDNLESHKLDDLINKNQNLVGVEDIKITNEKKHQQIQYIKIPAEKLDDLLNRVSELIINNSQLRESIINNKTSNLLKLSEDITKITNEIKEDTLNLRLIPVKSIIPPYRRIIRDLSVKLNKKINFIEDGVETQVDKTIIEKLYNPLLHIIRNAADHGIETPEERKRKGKPEIGTIRLLAYYSNVNVIIQIQDDGKGIDPEFIRQSAIELEIIKPSDNLTLKEIYNLVFIHGFTTMKKVSSVSGRGVGMDAIKNAILDLRGDIEIDSEIGLGTSVTLKLPLTLSIIDTLHVSTNNIHFLIPISTIDQCAKITRSEIQNYSGNRLIYNDELLPYIDIRKIFKIGGENLDEENLIIVNLGKQKIGLFFDRIYGEYQAVFKNLGTFFKELDFLSGASILGDGSVAYILDTYKLSKKISKKVLTEIK